MTPQTILKWCMIYVFAVILIDYVQMEKSIIRWQIDRRCWAGGERTNRKHIADGGFERKRCTYVTSRGNDVIISNAVRRWWGEREWDGRIWLSSDVYCSSWSASPHLPVNSAGTHNKLFIIISLWSSRTDPSGRIRDALRFSRREYEDFF